MPRDAADVLHSVFGFSGFRGQQDEIVRHVIAGGDALVLMPTGGGKSLCYQVPALCRDGVAVVVSPLIALMQDQVAALRQLGIRAAALNSSMAFGEAVEAERAMRSDEIDVVYVAPERLLTERFMTHLGQCRIALFAIDEAHCVSQWGHDFRPEYQQLNILHERFPDVPRIALTATADGPTRRDIVDRLNLAEGRVFVAGFDRPNIQYRVLENADGRNALLRFIETEHKGEAGIVYCMSRAGVDRVAAWLSGKGVPALPYHAGLDRGVRSANQERFIKDDGIVMVATIAFGMGIDKPDVRFVAHLGLPKSLEAYYQETGRAGRDGLPSDAWMLYDVADAVQLNSLIEGSNAPDRQKQVERQKLDALLGYCETTRCRRQVLLGYFDDSCDPCGNCDICLEPPETFDGTEAARKALSCVYRTGERFGAAHVIDVLRGADTERVRKLGHGALSTYGIGSDMSVAVWRSIFRQLIAMRLLEVDTEGHGGLHLGPDCRDVLRGERKVELRRAKPETARGGAGRRPRATLTDAADESLFDALRAHRLSLAKEQGLPPYVIFHDSTLLEMARLKPRSLNQIAGLTGVGRAKLERYGASFLAVVGAQLAAQR